MAKSEKRRNSRSKSKLLLRYPHLGTTRKRWEHLLACVREKGGPSSWARWLDCVKDSKGRFCFRSRDKTISYDERALTEKFSTWRGGSKRNVIPFEAKMALLQPIEDFLGDSELAWSAYWLESGCEDVIARGNRAHHFLEVEEPPEERGGPNIHDKALAKDYLKRLRATPKRGRPRIPEENPLGPVLFQQFTSDGREDFPPWYRQVTHQRQRETEYLPEKGTDVSERKRMTRKETAESRPPAPDFTHEVANDIRVYGRGAIMRMGIYFKGEPWNEFSPMAKASG